MTRNEEELKALVKRAAKAKSDHPTLSVLEAMRVATLTLEESNDRTLQMRVRRSYLPPPQAINVVESSPASTVSTLTPPNFATLPKLKKIRLTSAAAQQKRANDLKVKLHHKAAHKRATSLYASEQSKPVGEKKMLASEVSNLVFGDFGVEISIRIIQREVAEDRIGVSPKKKGPQGIIPPLIYDTLCNAFESYIQIKQLNGQGTDITNNKLIELVEERHEICYCIILQSLAVLFVEVYSIGADKRKKQQYGGKAGALDNIF